MIIIPATGTNLRTSKYWHTRREVIATSAVSNLLEDCCFCSCSTEIPAFAYLDDGSDKEKNDIFDWIFKVPTDATVLAVLTNVSTGTEYIINDQTYGDFYDVGVVKSDVWGFILKWYNVANTIGFGEYSMTITISDFNSNILSTKEFPHFMLMPYSCEDAHGTVRIEAWNSGYIESGFDYRGININNPFVENLSAKKIRYWVSQIRYYGRFERTKPSVKVDNHYDNYRNLTQVQTQIQKEWNLRLDSIKSDISEDIIYNDLLADFLYISDYNANSIDKYRNIKVSLVDVDSENFLNQTNQFNIKLADYKQDNLKRHA